MREERNQSKHVAILAADVVGYSRLAGSDQTRVVSQLAALWAGIVCPEINVRSGHVVSFMGDGVLISFGSVLDAFEAAIGLQKRLHERNSRLPPEQHIEFRIGIHCGEVAETDFGHVAGAVTDIAVRLGSSAEVGTIRLSDAAYDEIPKQIEADFTDLGITELKNPIRAVRVYRASPREPAATLPGARVVADLPSASVPSDPLEDLLQQARSRKMTQDERLEQAISFVFGNENVEEDSVARATVTISIHPT